ncbi:MAG: prolipoprotein diacylglyceryl transferase [Dehalococcoidales bacterium]|nr:prolipoprotein diacylglyceryl transferase [Dehalococcoidales bacterium]
MFIINVNPVAFTIGSHDIRWYGIIVAIAVVTVVVWSWRRIDIATDPARRPNPIIAPIGIISGILGAKLFHVFERLSYYIQYPGQFFSSGGFAIYGGILGATFGIWIYTKLNQKSMEQLGHPFGFFIDIVTPGIALAQAIGRVGCTVNGCCYGNPAPDWLPWSVIYTHPNSYAPLGIPLQPTQPYEIAFCLLCFGILLKLKKHIKTPGSLFLIYLVMYSAWRMGLGFLRPADVYIHGLSEAQIVALVLLAIAIPLLIRHRHRLKVAENLPD